MWKLAPSFEPLANEWTLTKTNVKTLVTRLADMIYISYGSSILPAVLDVLLGALCEEDEEGGECAEWRAELRVRPAAGASTFPLSSWGVGLKGVFCLREGGLEGGGDGSLFPVTLDDTRLFLSGLEVKFEERMKTNSPTAQEEPQKPKSSTYLDAVLLEGDSSLLLLLLFMA